MASESPRNLDSSLISRHVNKESRLNCVGIRIYIHVHAWTYMYACTAVLCKVLYNTSLVMAAIKESSQVCVPSLHVDGDV